jgi:flavorubredoxin
MKAVVVYESLWGNTAAIARAIAEGIGPQTQALTTEATSAETVATADLVVAGGPVLGFRLAGEAMRESVAQSEANAPTPPDMSHPSLRAWLDTLPHGHGRSAAFETRIWWSPRGATGDIESRLKRAGYQPIAKAQKFVVTDKYGPLREGELERARRWGAELSQAVAADTSTGGALGEDRSEPDR